MRPTRAAEQGIAAATRSSAALSPYAKPNVVPPTARITFKAMRSPKPVLRHNLNINSNSILIEEALLKGIREEEGDQHEPDNLQKGYA